MILGLLGQGAQETPPLVLRGTGGAILGFTVFAQPNPSLGAKRNRAKKISTNRANAAADRAAADRAGENLVS
jgi:hypothetical protein